MLSTEEILFLSQVQNFEFTLWTCRSIITLSDQDFGLFLAGMIEGDGCFDKSGLEIGFDCRDIALANGVASRLGVDPSVAITWRKPRQRHHKGWWRLRIAKDNPNMENVLRLTNGCFVGDEKLEQIEKHRINKAKDGKPRVKLLPGKAANATGFWISGFFAADGSVFISAQNKVSIDFSQNKVFLPDLIAAHFGLTTIEDWREKRQRFEYHVKTADYEKLADFFAHFHQYPCMGIKQGQLFFAQQAQVFKMSVYQRHESEDRERYMQGCRTLMHRLNCKSNTWVYHFGPTSLDGQLLDEVKVADSNMALSRKIFRLSQSGLDERLRQQPANMLLWSLDVEVPSAKASSTGTDLAVWHTIEKIYGFFPSLTCADRLTNQNRPRLTARLNDPNDPWVRQWDDLSPNEKAQAHNAHKATDPTPVSRSTKTVAVGVWKADEQAYYYCSSLREASRVSGVNRKWIVENLEPTDRLIIRWDKLSDAEKARGLNVPKGVPKGKQKASTGRVRIPVAVWNSELQAYRYCSSRRDAGRYTNQNPKVIDRRAADSKDRFIVFWRDLSPDEQAKAFNDPNKVKVKD